MGENCRRLIADYAIVEEGHGDLLQGGYERTPMKIRITVNQSANCLPCAHRDLTLAGRSMRLQGLALKRSTERYTCNACGKPLVRTLNMSWSYWPVPNHHTTEMRLSDTKS
jgi:transposase-like protein